MDRLFLPLCFILFAVLLCSQEAFAGKYTMNTSYLSGCRSTLESRAKDIFDDKVAITWDPVSSAVGYKIKLRRVGAPTWEFIVNTGYTHGFTFLGLDPCTTYEYSIKTHCTSGESDYSDIFTFTTEGDCFLTTTLDLLSESEYDLSVFPNPSFGDISINLDTKAAANGTVRIINNDGQELLQLPIQSGKTLRIRAGQLPPGIYWCQFFLENGKCTPGKRIIIQ